MKIVINIGNLKKGGAERVASNLCNYFVEDGNEVSIIMTTNEKKYYELNEKIKLYSLDKKATNKNIIIKNINRIISLKKILKEIKSDIVISFLPEPSYRILFLKFFNRKLKVIVSVRNDPKVEYKSKTNKIVMKILYPFADGFVFQTEEAKNYFNEKIQQKSIIIPNPINKQFISATINKNRKKLIINVGRLEEQKNQEMLIDAFYEVNKKHNDYKMIIYGEGGLRSKLEKKIKELGLENKVMLPGNADNIIEKLNEAEIFVLSSNYEGMPNALMEAMSMGLACISTDCPCGGPRYLINNKHNGILINNNKNELINSLNDLIENDLLREKIALNAIDIRNKLNPNLINKKWNDFIRSINK